MSDNNGGSSHVYQQTTYTIESPEQSLDWAWNVISEELSKQLIDMMCIQREVLFMAHNALIHGTISPQQVPVFMGSKMSGLGYRQQTLHVPTPSTQSREFSVPDMNSGCMVSRGEAMSSIGAIDSSSSTAMVQRGYACQGCSKSFTKEFNRDRHWDFHCEGNPNRKYFPCPECKQQFTRKHHMDFHAKNQHQG